MAEPWILVPCLVQLRAEVNRIAPSRDEASDGTIGDAAHQAEVSDHNPDEVGSVPIHDADRTNEVHAWDADDDLRESDLTMEKVVQFLLGRCRSGKETRLRYIIYNRRIWEASNGWKQRAYTGPSAHTEHAHFSASYETAKEASTASWHLEDIPVALTQADKNFITAQIQANIDEVAAEAAKRVWATQFQRPGEEAGKTTSAAAYQAYNDQVNKETADAAAAHVLAVIEPKLDAIAATLAVTKE